MDTKTYKTKLNIKSKKDLDAFKKMAGIYRLLYNLSLEAQEYKATHSPSPESYFINGTQLLSVMRTVKNAYSFVKKVDCGIFTAAVFAASKAYLRAFKLKIPKFMSRKKDTLRFKTQSIKVFYDSIAIPKFGKVKLFEKGYIPQGKNYSDVTFSFDGVDWWVSLKVSEEHQKETDLSGSIKIDFDAKGNLLVNGEVFKENVVESCNYKRVLNRYNKALKKYKRQAKENTEVNVTKHVCRTSRNMMKTRRKVAKLSARLMSIKKDYFKKAANELARLKPLKVQALSNYAIRRMRNGYLSRKLRESDTNDFFNIVLRKLALIGASIERCYYPVLCVS